MKRLFADELIKQMATDKDIVIVSMDLGYLMWDQIREVYPNRFWNVGASEQAGLDIAVGLALSGKKPFVYSITPFLIYRGFETLRTYIDHENIPVRLIGSGRDNDYENEGFSHDATDVKKILSTLPNIIQYYPNLEEIPLLVKKMVELNKPQFISLSKWKA